MTHFLVKTAIAPLTVDLSSLVLHSNITDEQFYEFCSLNRDLRIERSAEGEVIVMSPTFADTGNRNSRILQQLINWADRDGTGEVFDSSTGFTLPNRALRSPDASWIERERWDALSEEQKASFTPIAPDFVVELRSASDTLTSLQEKMQEYIENGVRLGLLIDRSDRAVRVYRPGRAPEILANPDSVNCEPELPGFALLMARIW